MSVLAWGVGVAGAPALVPDPATFGAAAQPKAENDEAQNRYQTPMHKNSLAHRVACGERPFGLKVSTA
jgi:hypothetical protein